MLPHRRWSHKPVKRVFHQKVIAEGIIDRASAHIQIAHPAPAVALWRIPDIILHAQVRRVRANRPHQVQFWVRRLKEPLIFDRVIDQLVINGFEAGLLAAYKSDDRIAERALRPISGTVRRNIKRILAKKWLLQRLSL